MRNDQMLARAVALLALAPVAAAARREQTSVVAQNRGAPRLVERNPVLYLREILEADLGVVLEVRGELLLVQHATVSLVELLGKVPMEEGDEGGDPIGSELVNKLLVVFDTLGVDGVVAAAEGNHPRPGDGEAVGASTVRFEEGDVLFGAVKGVAGDVTGAAVGGLAGNVREGVPNRGATAAFVRTAFNLVAKAELSVAVVAWRGGEIPGGSIAPEEVLGEGELSFGRHDGLRGSCGYRFAELETEDF